MPATLAVWALMDENLGERRTDGQTDRRGYGMARDTRQCGLVPREGRSVCAPTHSFMGSSLYRGAGCWALG